MRKLFFIWMSMLLLVACNSSHNTNDLSLNDGEKWKVNEEMLPHISKANEILNDYVMAKGTNHQLLAEELKNQNNNLIKSCTMKGESHDELHKWLYPHIGLIEKLSTASNSNEAEAVVTRIEQSFRVYRDYFE